MEGTPTLYIPYIIYVYIYIHIQTYTYIYIYILKRKFAGVWGALFMRIVFYSLRFLF